MELPSVLMLLTLSGLGVSNANDLQVNTTSGVVEGTTMQVQMYNNDTKQVSVFLGIPYAEPPTGSLRLQLPQLKVRMTGVFNASNFGPICPQNTAWLRGLLPFFPPSALVVNESCLVLNIYVPESENSSTPLAVMVWIHGGAYNIGTANIHDGKLLSATGGVIVVAMNYRLGALGFLATEDGHDFGNYGMWDQLTALVWVKHNIAEFGGDSSRITIFGESAGASSVSLLSLSVAVTNTELFQRVISESGSALVPWAIIENPGTWAKIYSSYAKCPESPIEMLECLRSKSVDDLIKAQVIMEVIEPAPEGKIQFGPYVDLLLFKNSPAEITVNLTNSTAARNCGNLDHLIGTNSQEGALFYNMQMKDYRDKLHLNDSINGIPESLFRDLLNNVVRSYGKVNYTDALYSVMQYRYTDFDGPYNGMNRAIQFIETLSDSWFYAGIVTFARFLARQQNITGSTSPTGKTYFYYFDHRGSWESHEPWRTGADHGDEIRFVFGQPLLPGFQSTGQEKALTASIMTYWSNFAKTGNPNLPDDSLNSEEWPPYTTENEFFIHLAVNTTSGDGMIGSNLKPDRVAFWTDFIPKFNGALPTITTCKPVTVAPPSGKASRVTGSCLLILLINFLVTHMPHPNQWISVTYA